MSIIIRRATFEDSAGIANVHINSWREAYKGLVPDQFLNERPLFFKNRYELWKKVTVNKGQDTFVAVDPESGVIGFVNGTNGRDDGLKEHAEVWCLYLLEKFHGQKIGFRLLKNFFDSQAVLGKSKGYVWVLEGNPSISFYERTGAVATGKTMQDSIGGRDVTELCFEWPNIELS